MILLHAAIANLPFIVLKSRSNVSKVAKVGPCEQRGTKHTFLRGFLQHLEPEEWSDIVRKLPI